MAVRKLEKDITRRGVFLFSYALTIGIMLCITVSCNVSGNHCGSSESYFKVTDFNTAINKINSIDSVYIDVSPLQNDTILFSEMAITMGPVPEIYSLKQNNHNTFNFVPAAYACPPALLVSEEMITDIKITSNKAYNNEYSAGDNMADLFDIFVFYQQSGLQRYDLTEFLEKEHTVPERIILVLKKAPPSARTMKYTIQYLQDGLELEKYHYTTRQLTITN